VFKIKGKRNKHHNTLGNEEAGSSKTGYRGVKMGYCQGKLFICQQNIHHRRSASAMLLKSCDVDALDIVLVQEIWILQNEIREIVLQKTISRDPVSGIGLSRKDENFMTESIIET